LENDQQRFSNRKESQEQTGLLLATKRIRKRKLHFGEKDDTCHED
jgi:hypothetical protein